MRVQQQVLVQEWGAHLSNQLLYSLFVGLGDPSDFLQATLGCKPNC